MINWFRSALWLLLFPAFSVTAGQGCVDCHTEEVRQWSESQHAMAMAEATEDSVAGDFSGSEYRDEDIQATFYRDEGEFRIRVRENAKTETWPVVYTLGIYPLQQYLIDIGGGRLQAFNIAWDTRAEKDGGQRWFRLDDPTQSHPGSAFHWKGIYQNWNNQCADCHATGLIRNYDPETDTYSTTWQQVAVSCEACHGQASQHAEAKKRGGRHAAGIDLIARGIWLVSNAEKPPRHTGDASSPFQVPACGRCHALRTSLEDKPGGLVHNQFRLTRLDEPLYFPDGRVREEVFVLGSFEQSKMFQAGVVCSNCHNPHTGKLKAEGNAVCTQCHNAGIYDVSEHHHHPRTSKGAQCVNCHMPERTFMRIDARREHRFMVPRPDVAKASGSPDPCQACHTSRDAEWSIATVADWAPDLFAQDTWYQAQQGSLETLIDYITDRQKPAIRRATLLERYGQQLAQQKPAIIRRLMASEQAAVRESAFRMARHMQSEPLAKEFERGLADPMLAVRLAAFESMMLRGDLADVEVPGPVTQAYEHFLDLQADLPSGRVLKARYLLSQVEVGKAEKQLRVALKKDNGYTPAALLLTNVLRADGRLDDALAVINDTLKQASDNASLIHIRGLIYLKKQAYSAALEDLERSAGLAPERWIFGYRYAVALYQLGYHTQAREVVRRLLEMHPDNPQLQALEQAL